MKNLFRNLKVVWNTTFKTMMMVLIIGILLTACTKPEDPIQEPNKNPTATLTVTLNADKTLSGTLTGTDSDGTISLKEIEIKNGSTSVAKFAVTGGNNWNSSVLTAGSYTIIGTVTDNEGAAASKTNTKTILGLAVSITAGTVAYDDNQETNQTVVGTFVNTNNIAGVTYSLDTDAQNYFEIVGNDIKWKTGIPADFETLKSSFTITGTAKATGEIDATVTVQITITDKDDREEDVVVKTTHCMAGFAWIDVADNDPDTKNRVLYRIDHTGALTSQTFAELKNALATNNGFSFPDGNLLDMFTTAQALIKDDSNAKVLDHDSTGGLGTFRRLAFSFTNLNDGSTYNQTATNVTGEFWKKQIGQANLDLKDHYSGNTNPNNWDSPGAVTGDGYRYIGFILIHSNFYARMQPPNDMSLEDAFVYGFAQSINVVRSQDQAGIEAIVNELWQQGYIKNNNLLASCN